MDLRSADPIQVRREMALDEIVAPYLTTDGELNVQRGTDAIFRDLVRDLMGEPLPRIGGPEPFDALAQRFQQELADQVRHRGGRGRPRVLLALWQQLGLPDPDRDSDAFTERASGLCLLTLHQLLQATLRAVSAEDLAEPKPVEPPAAADAEEEDPSALELDRADREDGDEEETEEVGPDSGVAISQQQFYALLWPMLAFELALHRQAPAQATGTVRQVSRLTGEALRARLRGAMQAEVEQACGLDAETGMTFAAALTDLVIASTEPKWFSIEQRQFKKSAQLFPSAALLARVRDLGDTRRLVTRTAALIRPPLPWGPQGTRHGGFHWRPLPFIKFPWQNAPIRIFLGKIEDSPDLSGPFDAANLLQDTAWRVNGRVWEVVRSLFELAGVRTGAPPENHLFPSAEQGLGDADPDGAVLLARLSEHLRQSGAYDTPTPATQLGPTEQKAWQAWTVSRFVGPRHRGVRIGPGGRLLTRVVFSTLMDLAPRSRFWMSWQADTRGRLYPVAGQINPQNDDLIRGLLEFAEGKPLTEAGAEALALHGSAQIARERLMKDLHLAQSSELTQRQRIEWVQRHEEEIVASAKDPLAHPWWREPEVAKEPFRFLAFCFAWADYRRFGPSTVCRLPVQVDGTCNGLQHIGAAMRDRALATATNVLPADGPQDIYESIAALVRARLGQQTSTRSRRKAGAEKQELTEADREAVRQFLASFPDLLGRDAAKAVVMVIPYGAGLDRHQATLATALVRQVLREWWKVEKKQDEKKPVEPKPAAKWIYQNVDLDAWQPPPDIIRHRRRPPSAEYLRDWAAARWLRLVCARQLALTFNEVLRAEYPVIEAFTRTLQQAIKPVLARDLPVMWVAPSGFPVLQRAFQMDIRTADVKSLPGRVRFAVQRPRDTISKKRQQTGILPNFIHSLDAAHLVATARLARSRGITALSAVHDAFGTHACDLATLQGCIRDGFVEVYPPGLSQLDRFVAWCHVLGGEEPPPTLVLTESERRLVKVAEELAKDSTPDRTTSAGKPCGPRVEMPAPDWIEEVRQSTYFFS